MNSTKHWVVYPMSGSCPPYNDWATWVKDANHNRLFLLGGVHPGDRTCTYTSDFHSCNLATMKWANLTDSMSYINPYDPFSPIDKNRPLPATRQPAASLFHNNGRTFLFLFGGWDSDEECALSNTIAIDVDRLEWWYLKVEGGPVDVRINAAMASSGNRLFIFGGLNDLGDSPSSHRSYSIAQYFSDQGIWKWVKRDAPFPDYVPSMGMDGKAVAVYGGKKILLAPGRLGNQDASVFSDIVNTNRPSFLQRIHLSKDNVVLFHTENLNFQIVNETVGSFPRNILWYTLELIEPKPHIVPPTLSHTRNRHHPNRKERRNFETILAASSSTSTTSTHWQNPAVIICAWIPGSDNCTQTEVWKYCLPPEEKVICFNISKEIWKMDEDLQFATTNGDELLLFGYDQLNEPSERQSSTDSDSDDSSEDPAAVWNIFVRVPLTS